MSVYLIWVYTSQRMHLMDVYLSGVYLMGAYLMGAYLIVCASRGCISRVCASHKHAFLIGVHLIGVHLTGLYILIPFYVPARGPVSEREYTRISRQGGTFNTHSRIHFSSSGNTE
jgi:uncharacterized protein YjbI with pentapeptide repeats